MKTSKHLLILSLILSFTLPTHAQDTFAIRGVLPWHNFLSGPSAWNEKDYEQYLDDCVENKINFIGFHNYTGGGERYVTYVEPMIKISYKGITPQAYFDHSLSARWGYLPLPLSEFTAESQKVLDVPQGAKAFGCDCAVLSNTPEEHYACSQALMQRVLKMAHDRKIQMAMGFEFGVVPPEYFSLSKNADCFYWPGEANMIPNPSHPTAIELHQAALNNILDTYPDIDWIWLWLNEHSFMGVDLKRALADPYFSKLFEANKKYFPEATTDQERFVGVWAMEYMRITSEYLRQRGSKAKLILGGWGGGNQLPMLLKGLNRALPKDIVFSCLNPVLGLYPQPDFLADIAKDRRVWAVPWLEGDHQLWHFQPKVQMLSEHVKLAKEQQLDGVLAIHWRTAETRYNMKAFAHFASDPASKKTTTQLYEDYFTEEIGNKAAKKLAPLVAKMDDKQIFSNVSSPEFYAYTPEWGVLDKANIEARTQIIKELDDLLKGEKDTKHRTAMERFSAMFQFELLLHGVAVGMKPAYELKNRYTRDPSSISAAEVTEAYAHLTRVPLEQMIAVYASKVSTRGEMGVLSSINQRVCSEYKELKAFLESRL